MKIAKLTCFFAALMLFAFSGYAQITPQPSSTQTIVQDFGLGKITLTYSRPNVKGRKIFGYVEPYGKVWRTGANSATVIKFSDDVSLEGHAVPAGEYGLFSIPGESEWTIILSKKPKQWGAYTYSDKDDFVRFTVKAEKMSPKVETFGMQFINLYPTSGDLMLTWENAAVDIHLTCDIDVKVMAKIDSAMNTDNKPYYDGVVYYWNNHKDIKKALEWSDHLETVKGMPLMVAKLWKARMLLRNGDKTGAVKVANEGIKAAEAAKSSEYARLNTEVITEAGK